MLLSGCGGSGGGGPERWGEQVSPVENGDKGSDASGSPEAGRPVQPGQTVQSVTGQDPVHRGGGQPEDRADPGRTELAGLPQIADSGFRLGDRAMRGRVRPAGAVEQPRIAFRAPASHPLVGGCP